MKNNKEIYFRGQISNDMKITLYFSKKHTGQTKDYLLILYAHLCFSRKPDNFSLSKKKNLS